MIKSSVAKGTVSAPPSKSYTHRAMVLGALTRSQVTLVNPLVSEDTKATIAALRNMGSEIRTVPHGISVCCEELVNPGTVLDAKNSGTTIRLMTGVASLLSSTTTLTGDESLQRRPMGPLVEALEQLGAQSKYLGKSGMPPLSIKGPITGNRTTIEAGVSSQFVSSVLIACLRKKGDTEIHLRGELRSRPYVDITLRMIADFHGRAVESKGSFHVPGSQELKIDTYSIPGDYSSSSFPLSAAAITGGEVSVRNLAKDSPQGDRAIVNHLRAFGADVKVSADSVKVKGDGLQGTEIDVMHTPDLFPVLAVVGSVAKGRTVLKGGENLRSKESDRIATTTNFLRKMGAKIHPRPDGCEIEGVDRLHGASVETHGDHRILMAAAVAGLVSTSETRIEDNESYAVSYPGFITDMHQLGCRLAVTK